MGRKCRLLAWSTVSTSQQQSSILPCTGCTCSGGEGGCSGCARGVQCGAASGSRAEPAHVAHFGAEPHGPASKRPVLTSHTWHFKYSYKAFCATTTRAATSSSAARRAILVDNGADARREAYNLYRNVRSSPQRDTRGARGGGHEYAARCSVLKDVWQLLLAR